MREFPYGAKVLRVGMPCRCGWVFNDGDFSGDCKRGPKFDGVVEESGADLGLLVLFVSEMW